MSDRLPRGGYSVAERFFQRLCPKYEDDGYPLPTPQWEYEAKCRNIDANKIESTFFPGKGFGPDKYREARAICRPCPVKADCLEAAIREEGREPHGMRAGKSPERRLEIFRDRQAHKAAQAENNKHQRKTK